MESRWLLYDRCHGHDVLRDTYSRYAVFYDRKMAVWRYRYVCLGLYEFPDGTEYPPALDHFSGWEWVERHHTRRLIDAHYGITTVRDSWISRRAYRYFCDRAADAPKDARGDRLRAENDFETEVVYSKQLGLFLDDRYGNAIADPKHIPKIPERYEMGDVVDTPTGVGYIDQLILDRHAMICRIRLANGMVQLAGQQELMPPPEDHDLYAENVRGGKVAILQTGESALIAEPNELMIGTVVPSGRVLRRRQTYRVIRVVQQREP